MSTFKLREGERLCRVVLTPVVVLSVLGLSGCGRDQRNRPGEAVSVPPEGAPAIENPWEDSYLSAGNQTEAFDDVLLRAGAPSPSRPSWIHFDEGIWAFDTPYASSLASVRAVDAAGNGAVPAGSPVFGESLAPEEYFWLPSQPRVFASGDEPLLGGPVGDALHFLTEEGWRLGQGYRFARGTDYLPRFGAAISKGKVYLARTVGETLVLEHAEPVDLTDTDAGVSAQGFLELGHCPPGLGRHLVFASEVGIDVLASCGEVELSHFHIDMMGEVTELLPFSGVRVFGLQLGTDSLGCGGEEVISDGDRLLFALPLTSGATVLSYDKRSGRFANLLSLSDDIVVGQRVTLASTAERVFTLAGGCERSEPTLCAFERETLAEVACHNIPYTIDGNKTHIFGSDGAAYFVYEDHRAGRTPALLDLSTTGLEQPPEATIIGAEVEAAYPLDLRCTDNHCEVLTREVAPNQPWPHDYFKDSRPVHYDVFFETGEVSRSPGDTIFWSRTPEARFGASPGRYYSLEGRNPRTVMKNDGSRQTTFDETLDDYVPIDGGLVAWERGRVCRFSDGAGEPDICVEGADYLQDTSGTNEMRLLRCGGEIYWSFVERTADYSDTIRSHRVRFSRFDSDTLEPEENLVDVTLEQQSFLINQPGMGCTDDFFFVSELPSSSVVHRFSLAGVPAPSHDFAVELTAEESISNLVLDDVLLKVRRRWENSRLDLFILGAAGAPLQRTAQLPEGATWLESVSLRDDSLVVAYQTRERGDLRLARLPLRTPAEIPSFSELTWPSLPPPPTPPTYAGVNSPPCADGIFWGDLVIDEQSALTGLESCRVVAGGLILGGQDLVFIEPLRNLEEVLGVVSVSQASSLESLAPLSNLVSVGGIELRGSESNEESLLEIGSALSSLARVGPGGVNLSHISDTKLELPSLTALDGPIEINAAPTLTEVELNSLFAVDNVYRFSMFSTGMTHCDIEALAARFGHSMVSQMDVCGNVADECGDEECFDFN